MNMAAANDTTEQSLALRLVGHVLSAAGFDPVLVGPLARAREFDVGTNVYNTEFAARQSAQFEEDLKKARRITYEEWKSRPIWVKAWDHIVGFFGPEL